MANYSVLKAAVQAVVKTNGNQEITGANMQSTLISIINSLGTGYQFMGVATPSTSPGTPDYNVAYIGGAGTYANFGTSITVPVGSIGVFKYNGSWTKEQIKMFDGIDEKPAIGSTNLITSGAVAELQKETTGVIGMPEWGQVTITAATGKFSSSNTRVTNRVPVVTKGNMRVICTGDVRCYYLYKFTASASPVNGGTENVDFKIVSVPSASYSDFFVEKDTAFPNNYIIFCRKSDFTQNITPEEVAANVKFIDTSSIEGNLDALQNFTETLSGEVAYGRHTFSESLVVRSGTQSIISYEFNYGNTIAVRVKSNTASVRTVEVAVRANGGSTYHAITNEWKKITSNYNIDRLYFYVYDCTNAGDITVEALWGDLARLYTPDTTATEDSYELITSGAVYEANENTKTELNTIINAKIEPLNDSIGKRNITSWSAEELTQVANTRVRFNEFSIEDGICFGTLNYTNVINCAVRFYDENDTKIYDSGWQTDTITFDTRNTDGVKYVDFYFMPRTVSEITISDVISSMTSIDYVIIPNVYQLIKNNEGTGNSIYFGRVQTLSITNETHTLNERLVCEHYNDEYPYTTKNQSMAIWDGKAFCFNDTNFAETDGWCVVIDVETGNVITRLTDTPSVIAGQNKSHLNAAQFTDQYYQYGDKYPLLLLSRGDYATPHASNLCMYVFRITEPTTNNFIFTRIKTINVLNNPLAVCNPSWGYDKNRRMIWGHLHSQDWRWGNSNYRKFDNVQLPFIAPTGTEYICVTSGGATAATSATITIWLGGVQTMVAVSTGETLEKVLPYVPYESGSSVIGVNQSAEAFTGQYVVFACDENGNNRKELKFESVIQGFISPDLTDTTEVTIQPTDMTEPVYIDKCVFQGGSCANGKLFLPIEQYTTINNQPTDFTRNCCIVVEPTTGYIESIIKTDTMENEGCAIWNGKLYVSSHNGGATGHTIGFRLMEYSFD